MKKRLLSLILAMILLSSLLPVSAAALSSSEQEQIRTIVSDLITNYAAQMYRADSATESFIDFANHGLFGGGATMYVKEGDPILSSILNSVTGKAALIEGITDALITSQQLNMKTVFASGGISWASYGHDFSFVAYEGTKLENENYLGVINSCNTLYGTRLYPYGSNGHDDMMALVAGSLSTNFSVFPTKVTSDTVVYTINLKMLDTFDFDGQDYDTLKNSGFDTGTDERLNRIGKLMTYMGLDEFYWEFTKTFTIEVPNLCDHTSAAAYRWTVTTGDVPPQSQIGDGYTINTALPKHRAKGNWEQVGTYELEEPVVLRHDAPWVVEYDSVGITSFQTTPLYWINTKLPYLVQSSTQRASVAKYFFVDNDEHRYDYMDYSIHYVGTALNAQSYSSKHSYTTRWENDPATGKIYFSIYDHSTGETVFGPEPLTTLWERVKSESKEREPVVIDYVNEDDIIINYIGSKYIPLSDQISEIRILENGTNSSAVKSPTCTEQGGTVVTCGDCGCEVITEPVPALGHSYGEYVSDNNATCTENGTKTRICTRCGGKDTATDADTALGHDFGDYIYNKDASCTEDGTQSRNCSRCTVAETKDAPDTATGHSHQPAVTAPTCTAQGYTTYTCHCGDSYKADYVDATGHNYKMTIIAPTCTEQGYTVYTCHCGDTYKADYTDETGHSPVVDAAVPASCIGNGLTEGSHCEVCGYVIKAQNTVIGGTHLKDGGTIIKEATYETPGTVMYQCIYCGEKSYVVLPKLDKPEPVVNPFTDVKESDWFYNPVMWAVQSGVTGGKTATTFAPNEGCTRAQVVTFLWAANGKPMPEVTDNPFTDIKEGDWYYNAVLWAVENGITGGTSEYTFSPNATCTRAQIATFLWAAQGKHAVSDLSGFSDVAAADWYATPVIWAKEQGITDGIGGGKFGPNDTCTRAQVVTFLNKVYG